MSRAEPSLRAAPVPVFAALGDPTRLAVLAALPERPTPTLLAGALPVTRQAVSKHLLVLERAGLVRSRRDGRETRYELEPDGLRDAASWLDDAAREWPRRLDALERVVREQRAR